MASKILNHTMLSPNSMERVVLVGFKNGHPKMSKATLLGVLASISRI